MQLLVARLRQEGGTGPVVIYGVVSHVILLYNGCNQFAVVVPAALREYLLLLCCTWGHSIAVSLLPAVLLMLDAANGIY